MTAPTAALAALVGVMLAGCAGSHPDWERAPTTHDCTADQMAAVERETLFCNKNTGYISTYCYGTAIMRHCSLRAPTPGEPT